MKILITSLVLLIGCMPVFSQNNNIVDTTFVGIWSQMGQDTFLTRTEKPPTAGTSFQLLKDGALRFNANGHLLSGTWWSLNPDNFSMQISDAAHKTDYIWRFIYADETKMKIILVDYEEIKDYSGNFVGIWREVASENPEATRWVKTDKLKADEPGIIVDENGSVTRQLAVQKKKKTKIEICHPAILSTREDYFDFQYFSEEMNVIFIEGFELNLDKNNAILVRTRMNKLTN